VRRPEFEYAQVILREPANGWEAGTRGVIVDAFEDKAIIEIADRRGHTLDLLTLPYSAVTVFKHPEQEHDRIGSV
jgi:hypothetical protein